MVNSKSALRIKNYTSEVPPARSIAAIEELLVQFGARHISKSYDDQKNVSGFIFQVVVDGRPIAFKLPCRVDAVNNVLLKKQKRSWNSTVRNRVALQAQRTAWRLLYDWVAVQLTMIRLGQAEAEQVFLPYAYNYGTEQTVFEDFKQGGFKQLSAPKEGAEEGQYTEA